MEAVSYTSHKNSNIVIEQYVATAYDIAMICERTELFLNAPIEDDYITNLQESKLHYRIVVDGDVRGIMSIRDTDIASAWDLQRLTATERILFLWEVIKYHTVIRMNPHKNEYSAVKSLVSFRDRLQYERQGGMIMFRARHMIAKFNITDASLNRLGYTKDIDGCSS